VTVPQVLNFWFGQIKEEPAYLKERVQYWFGKNDEADRKIRDEFLKTWEAGMAGDLNPWADNPRGRLALVITLDQFPRNMFRGTPKMFISDPKALELCLDGISLRHDRQLHAIERVFMYMPLQHSEDLSVQRKSMETFEKLRGELRLRGSPLRDHRALRPFPPPQRNSRPRVH
jgi:uncharacterized protein (DUF924 family)